LTTLNPTKKDKSCKSRANHFSHLRPLIVDWLSSDSSAL